MKREKKSFKKNLLIEGKGEKAEGCLVPFFDMGGGNQTNKNQKTNGIWVLHVNRDRKGRGEMGEEGKERSEGGYEEVGRKEGGRE